MPLLVIASTQFRRLKEGAQQFGVEKLSILWTYFLISPLVDVNF